MIIHNEHLNHKTPFFFLLSLSLFLSLYWSLSLYWFLLLCSV